MADQSGQDVVNQALSVGDPSPSDVPAPTTNTIIPAEGGVEGGAVAQEKNNIQEDHIDAEKSSIPSIQTEPLGGGDGAMESPVSEPQRENLDGSDAINTFQDGYANGILSGLDAADDLNLQQALADASGGSDTDASRPDSGAAADGGHNRASSVKKPTTFKAVSFTKTFLKQAKGTTPIAKSATDKSSFSSANSSGTSVLQSSRPRLVAKTTSGLRDSAPKSKILGSKGGPGGGPDPMQVWNKNRPTQPTPPKHLTDEELKQQYGIHMTSRIQGDGDGKEAKWADIDDDEDDWAPETIEWNDGTKITLTQSENTAVAVPETQTMDISSETQSEAQTAKLSTKLPSSVGPNATILKLGGNREAQQSKPGSVALKIGTDKSSSTPSRGVVPTPSKSPWAPLPPVDKVPPVAINPPQPMASPRQQQQDGQGYEQMPPFQRPEMNADDFNRSWRNGQTDHTRELFNSQSGRYEPVREGRRSSRHEQSYRQPAVLQRPLPNDQQGPAEPSAAFQTHRTSQEGAGWARRRNSSNVSGGSGSLGRRMSLGRPQEPTPTAGDLQQRRGSQQLGSIDRVGSPHPLPYSHSGQQKSALPATVHSPVQVPSNPLYAQGSPASQPTQLSSPGLPPPQTFPGQAEAPAHPQSFHVTPEDVANQARIMRESMLEAKKRRMEEEEREEAAKRERLAAKLAAMGPPPAKEKPAQEARPAQKPVDAPLKSPPKPPVPEATGEPMQYGMMKVHHPESVKKYAVSNERTLEGSMEQGSQPRRASASTKQDVSKVSPTAKVNGVHPASNEQGSGVQAEPQARNIVKERLNQGWSNANNSNNVANVANVNNLAHSQPTVGGSSVASPWGVARPGQPSSGGSLWGPPANDKDRALGNGTFDRNLTPFFTRDLALRNNISQPQAPQMPLAGNNDSRPIEGSVSQQPYSSAPGPPHTTSSNPPQPSENFQSVPTFPSPEKRPIVENSLQDTSPQTHHPSPIGPPNARPITMRGPQPPSSRSATTATWNNFQLTAQRQEAEENEKYLQELAARKEEELRTGILYVPPVPQITETWRQVDINEDGGPRNIVKATKTNHNVAQTAVFGPVGSLPGGDQARPIGTGRGSRFFPQQADPPQTHGRRAFSYTPVSTISPSPPPPEESTHPVNYGDIHHPTVNFPMPKPVVKLPPSLAPPPASAATSPSQLTPNSLRVVSQPIASTLSWQDRFNGLLGKKTSPGKTSVLAVASSSKEPLDVVAFSAAVSLPQREDENQLTMIDAGKVTSKEVEDEEEIFEDREAGSLPIVRLPLMAPPNAWTASGAHDLPKAKPVEPSSVDLIHLTLPGRAINITLPGMTTPITRTLPRKAPQSENHTHPRNRNTSGYNKPRKGQNNSKSRDTSGTYNSSRLDNNGASSNQSHGASRTGYQGKWAKPAAMKAH